MTAPIKARSTLVGVVAAAIAGCGGATTASGDSNGQAAPAHTTDGSRTTPANTSTANGASARNPRTMATSKPVRRAIQALRTATRNVPRGTPYDLERERYRGKRIWDIKVASGHRRPYKRYVSANGRRVVRSHRSHFDDDASKALRAKVRFARALRTADRRAPGRLTEGEIDRHRGRIAWTATFRRGRIETEVFVDARTGKILEVQRESEDD